MAQKAKAAGATDYLTKPYSPFDLLKLIRQHLPDLKVRFVNVVDLMRLQDATEHQLAASVDEFDVHRLEFQRKLVS